MSNQENLDFIPTPKQKDFLDQLMTTYCVLINNVTGIEPSQVSMEAQAVRVFEEVEIYGYVLNKMHTYHDLVIDYEPYTEFENFPTLGEGFNEIAGKALVKEGLLSRKDF